jgi:hypothetical protein
MRVPGGESSWMRYTVDLPASLFFAGKVIQKVTNVSSFDFALSHSDRFADMEKSAATDVFDGTALEGVWSAQILGVDGFHAPTSLVVRVRL